MTIPASAPAHDAATVERDRILSLLRRHRPDLAERTVAGPSGALLVPGPGGARLEVGRLPRRGRARWVVVVPGADGVQVREARGPAAVVAEILRATEPAAAPQPRRARLLRSPP